jgi:hypothetical protein
MDPQDLGPVFGIVGGLIGLLVLVFVVFLWWRIFAKSGNAGALSLLLFVPIANLILIIWFAFSEWPIEKEVKALRAQQSMGGQRYAPPAGQPYR